jgi:LPXTG-site transpeptidase (sortase) family protein
LGCSTWGLLNLGVAQLWRLLNFGGGTVDTGGMIRAAIAGLGRVLVTSGVILLLFVGYQLWGTGIATARAQSDLEQTLSGGGFDAVPADLLDAATTGNTASSDTTVPLTIDTAEPTVAGGPETTIGSASPPASAPDLTVAPAPTAPPTTKFGKELVSRARTARKQVPIRSGEAMGQLVIPRISVDFSVVHGTSVDALKKGPGHYKTTPFPGEEGNAAIACHRTTFGAPCFRLDELQAGDSIFVARKDANGKAQWFKYVVASKQKVKPSNNSVLRRIEGRNTLTLTTCDPQYSAERRLIVSADLVGEAVDAELLTADEDPLAEEYRRQLEAKKATTTAAPATAAPTTVVAATEAATTIAGQLPNPTLFTNSVPGETLPSGGGTEDGEGDDPSLSEPGPGEPSFGGERGQGQTYKVWFFEGGSSAWLMTFLWAVICGLIWLGAWVVAKGRRKVVQRAAIYTVGFVVLFLPALYFCFENVSRLLPEAV